MHTSMQSFQELLTSTSQLLNASDHVSSSVRYNDASPHDIPDIAMWAQPSGVSELMKVPCEEVRVVDSSYV